jgi:copper homeostasis protein
LSGPGRELRESTPETLTAVPGLAPPLLEVIVQSVADARAAARGGADRLEVVRAIHVGGLTPPLALVHQIADAVSLPLRVMVRENAGYSIQPGERNMLRRAAAAFAEAGVDGLVLGFTHQGEIDLDSVAHVLDAAPHVRVTFHRAFDEAGDPWSALDAIARIPRIDRVLTSGGEGTAAVRCARLRTYQERAGSRLTIIAGGGVDKQMLRALVLAGRIREVHVGRAARDGRDPTGAVSATEVRRLRDVIERHG